MDKKNNGKKNIVSTVRRMLALVVVFALLLNTEVHAISMGVDAVKSLLGDEEQEEVIEKSNYAGLAAEEANAIRKSLADDGTGRVRKLRLASAKTLAVAMSEKIEAFDMQIDTKTAKMQSSVRSLKERERTMGTVRWSPLLNIKLPESPKEAEAFDFQFKPTQLQNQITLIKHKITETTLDINEKVSNLYIDIISAQQMVNYAQTRYKKLKNTVEKLDVKVKDGTAALSTGATETDADGNVVAVSMRVLRARAKKAKELYDNAEARFDAAKLELTNYLTKYEESKVKLSNLMGFDVTSGFTFEDAFVTAALNRDTIEYLYNYALADDAAVYEAQMAADEAYLTLKINYDLMKKHYSAFIGRIEGYVQQAIDGEEISKKAFKNDYDTFLKEIDSPWEGSFKVWFISIPREWLKGDTDGVRYVEDDPYVLYSAALEYQAARKELDNAKKELHNQIMENYSNYSSNRKAYLAANKSYVLAEKKLGLDEVSYLLGELSEDEFTSEEEEYQSLRDDAQSAMKEFSEVLYSFDRVTCGGLSKFLEGASAEKSTEALSLSPVIRKGCIYTIRPIIDSEEFLLTVDVPDDFYSSTGINVTHFELYCDGLQIGERTPVGKNLRHLTLSLQDLGECAIRVYDGETFIDECRIEPTVFSGPLNITIGYEEDLDLHTLGTYVASDDVATNMLVLTMEFDQAQVQNEYPSGQPAAFYRLAVNTGNYLLSDRLIPIDRQFTYLNFLKSDLDTLVIELFDSTNELIGYALFDTKRKEIYNDVDEETAQKIAEQKKQEAIERAEKEAEDEAMKAEREKREHAKELLDALGLPAEDEFSILYATKHIHALEYELELQEAIGNLKKENEQVKKQYKAMLENPDTDPKELKAVEDRLRISTEMPDFYEQTMTENKEAMYTEKELTQRKNRYKKEQLATYASCYNKKETSEDPEEIAALEATMQEALDKIHTVDAEYDIQAYFDDLKTFDGLLDKIYAFVQTDLNDEGGSGKVTKLLMNPNNYVRGTLIEKYTDAGLQITKFNTAVRYFGKISEEWINGIVKNLSGYTIYDFDKFEIRKSEMIGNNLKTCLNELSILNLEQIEKDDLIGALIMAQGKFDNYIKELTMQRTRKINEDITQIKVLFNSVPDRTGVWDTLNDLKASLAGEENSYKTYKNQIDTVERVMPWMMNSEPNVSYKKMMDASEIKIKEYKKKIEEEEAAVRENADKFNKETVIPAAEKAKELVADIDKLDIDITDEDLKKAMEDARKMPDNILKKGVLPENNG